MTSSKLDKTEFDLLDSSGAGFVLVSKSREIVWVNQTVGRFMGQDRSNLLGKKVSYVLAGLTTAFIENYDELLETVARAVSANAPIEAFECHILAGEGREERWIEFWSRIITEGEFAGGRIDHLYDITSRKKAQRRLQLLRSAVEQSSEGVAVFGLDGAIIFVNDAFARMHEYSADETLGKHFSVFRKTEPSDDSESIFARIVRDGELSGQAWHLTRSGRPFPVLAINTLIRDESGNVRGVLGTVRDISNQVRIEEDLRESRRVLSTLMSNLPGMAYRCKNDPQWTMEFVSAGCIPLTGYQPDQLIENRVVSYNDLIHPDDKQFVWNEVQAGVTIRMPFKLTYRIRTRSDEQKWVWEQGRGVFDERGELVALEGFIADVTERRRAEEALLESESKFRKLAETTNAVIFMYQKNHLIYANPAAHKVTGYSPKEMARMDFWEIIHPDQREDVMARGFARLKGDDVPIRYEVKILTKSGETVWLDYAGTVVDYQGEPAILGTAFEVTERKRAENQLRAATKELSRERQELTEKNMALKQILEHLEKERQQFKQEISQELERSVTPYLQRLKGIVGPDNRELKALEDNLQAIIRRDIDLFKERYGHLTPREFEICELIRKGLSSKQISHSLSLSVATVQKHREQIRKKLALTNLSINLGSYLKSH